MERKVKVALGIVILLATFFAIFKMYVAIMMETAFQTSQTLHFLTVGSSLMLSSIDREFLNRWINSSTREWHLPGYRFCGPGTRLEERLKNGDLPVNKLDEACLSHDKSYRSENLKDRHEADWSLIKESWNNFISLESDFEEIFWSFCVFLMMIVKYFGGL